MAFPNDSLFSMPLSHYGDAVVGGFKADTSVIEGMVPIGEGGDPLPYSVSTDSWVIFIYIVCLLLMMVAFSSSGKFFRRHLKGFFHYEKARVTTVPDTKTELRGLWLLGLNTVLVFGLGCYLFVSRQETIRFLFLPHQTLLFVFIGGVLLYFLLKICAYVFIDWVFFDNKKNLQWHKSLLLLTALEGVFLYPVVLVFPYMSIPVGIVVIYVGIVIILSKMAAFYKSFIIFFRRRGSFLQIFLYFCALEMMPLVVLYGLMAFFKEYLKFNF
ncbi:MAG: DUF4271 domain-containing protein [Prevotella sp.]|nr:DUF4271 domain-containing protein [Prevotella sp.]